MYCQEYTKFFYSLNNVHSISDTESKQCDEPIKVEEIIESIKHLRNKMSPGFDGITSELYKLFSEQVTPFLLEVFFREY
jgi:hypothetical protein